MRLYTQARKKTGINLTALIDILFLLIIFFAVSTKFTNQQAINANLPETITSSAISTTGKLIILMMNEAEIFVNGKRFTWQTIGEEIKQEKYDRTQKVICNIDKSISHGKVVQLLDILKIHNFTKVVFGTYDKP
jgi:biopolymer transport protein ExbD